jgi:hypothetical protein
MKLFSYLIYFNPFINKNPKLCYNCHYHRTSNFNTSVCSLFGNINILNGEINYQSCIVTRMNESYCGLDAKHYFRIIKFDD